MIYSSKIISRTNSDVPLFTSGKPMHSRYNPEREAETFCKDLKGDFFVILGLGGGFHVKKLIELKKNARLIVVEADKESLDYSISLNNNCTLLHNENITFTIKDNLYTVLLENYLPALYGNLSILTWRIWKDENPIISSDIEVILKKSLEDISADYSVQSHFGKIWHHNILLNAKLLDSKTINKISADNKKTASIIAAGPTFDNTIENLKKDLSNTVIFSTDTAFSSLIKNKIYPQFVISVDSQTISNTHFFNIDERCKDTVFVFDLSAPVSLTHELVHRGFKVTFISTGHPLSSLIIEESGIPLINSGSGTVTIAACDYARHLGFTDFNIYGADFCYNNGKSYTKGTYLETNYSSVSYRCSTLETLFDSLMYRVPLIKSTSQVQRSYTTVIMQRYKDSFEAWVHNNDGIINNNKVSFTSSIKQPYRNNNFNYSNFIDSYLTGLRDLIDNKNITKNKYLFASLPYISWCRKYNTEECHQNYIQLLENVYQKTLRFSIDHENTQ